jgi:esterase/lipase
VYNTDKEISHNLLCDQIIEFIEEKKLSEISIFGYSMGGYLALLANIKKPDLIGKIVTLATKLEWDEQIAAKELKQLELIHNLSPEHPFIKQLIYLHGKSNYQNCIKLTGNLMQTLGIEQPLNTASIIKIQSKILFILGALDHMVSQQETQKICQQIKDAEMILLPETKHPFEKVDQKQLSQLLIEFLI